VSDSPVRVFLDANVLAKPVTRTLILIAAEGSGYVAVWSPHVEAEADRHLRGDRAPVASVRGRLGMDLGPSGSGAEGFLSTEQLHAQLGRQHPRTVAAHAGAFGMPPEAPTHSPPAVVFRGGRCLRCEGSRQDLVDGVCAACSPRSTRGAS
jgi:hypothetical protein